MKSLRILGLAVAIWGVSVMPSAAWVFNDTGKGSHGGRHGGGGFNRGGGGCNFGNRGGPRFDKFRQPLADRLIVDANSPIFDIDSRFLQNPVRFIDGRFNGRFNNRDRFNRRDRFRGDDRGRDGDVVFFGGGGGYGYPYYPFGPYGPDYRVDYSASIPSRQSSSPYNIALNDGVHISPLDPGYNSAVAAARLGNGYAANAAYEAPLPPVAPAAPAAEVPAPLATDTDLVVGVQRQLRRLGYYRGVINGVSDSATRAAIRAYEANSGLPITGQLGTPLLKTLGFL